jgi:2-keto-4-pentenoate hydratase
MSAPVWEDQRVAAGMAQLLESLSTALDGGARQLGWKLAFGTEEAKANLGISGPVVGYLTDATELEPGAACSIGGWERPMLEAEIAIHLSADVPSGVDAGEAAGAIGAIGPAIELADADAPPERLAEVIGGDIFHRAVMVAPDSDRASPGDVADLAVVVSRDGVECARNDEPLSTVGDPAALVAHVADYLHAFGQSLRAGQLIISGSAVPLIALEPGQRLRYALEPVGGLELETAP